MSSLFSLQSAIAPSNNHTTFKDIQSSLVEESYFESVLTFISEARREYNHSKELLYTSITEHAGNQLCINESFETFFNNIIKIIDKFNKFIKNLFDRFIIYINKLVSSDKFINKNKDKFKNFNSDLHEFSYSGYVYSFSPDIPVMTAQSSYMDEFLDLETNKDIKSIYNNFTIKLKNDFYDKFRSIVIGTPYQFILSSDFSTELFKLYRNNADEKSELDIDNVYVLQALSDFLNNKNMGSDIKKAKNKLEKEYNEIKNYLKKSIQITDMNQPPVMAYKGSDGVEHKYDINELDNSSYLNLFIKAKTDQIEQMSYIHSMVFGAKLDALKEMYKQNRSILYKALQMIQKKGGGFNE